MRRATTPNIEIDIDQDLRGYWYRVAFKQQNGTTIIKDQNECILSDDGKTIFIELTQEETLRFSDSFNIHVQVRFGKDDKVCATNIVDTKVGKILDEEVIR